MSETEKIEQSVKAVEDLLLESVGGENDNLFLRGQLHCIEVVLRIIKRHKGVKSE